MASAAVCAYGLSHRLHKPVLPYRTQEGLRCAHLRFLQRRGVEHRHHGGQGAGIFVALFDILKATAACKLGAVLLPELEYAWQITGVSCVVGHMFPVFLGFRGGKGFACLGGVVLAHSAKVFLLMLAIAVLIGFVSNYIAVSAVAMSVIWPVYYGAATGNWAGAAILAIPFVPIFIKHTENFRRISRGEELRLSYLWKKDTELDRITRED